MAAGPQIVVLTLELINYLILDNDLNSLLVKRLSSLEVKWIETIFMDCLALVQAMNKCDDYVEMPIYVLFYWPTLSFF